MKRLTGLLLGATLLAGCSLQPGVSGMTAAQGDAVLEELRGIKQLLAEQRPQAAAAAPAATAAPAPAPAPSATVRLEDVEPNVFGAADAPVVLVEFTDYQCPFCKRWHERTWPDLKRKYVDTGRVRLVVRDMPLSFHSQALPAALAVRCAGEQGHFAAVHDALFAATELSAQVISSIVAGAGVVADTFAQCMSRLAMHAAIDADIAEAERLGIDGTPGFVVAKKSGTRLEGTLLVGAQPTAAFVTRIDALLAPPKAN